MLDTDYAAVLIVTITTNWLKLQRTIARRALACMSPHAVGSLKLQAYE